MAKVGDNELLRVLQEQKAMQLKGGIYHKTQVALTYNSNHIEGSKLTEEQTRFIFETNTLGVTDAAVNVDDVIETANHFKCIDLIIDQATQPLTETMIKQLHATLKNGTSDSRKAWFMVGDYKKLPNEVGGAKTCLPEKVAAAMQDLLDAYHRQGKQTLADIVAFHHDFEKIHPFQDGNGRVGRLIMFKECLANNLVPFIIDADLKFYYYRGLEKWHDEPGFLMDTCLAAQDKYREWLNYFGIPYQN